MSTSQKAIEIARLTEHRQALVDEHDRLEKTKIPKDATQRAHTRQRRMESLEAEMGRIDVRLTQLTGVKANWKRVTPNK